MKLMRLFTTAVLILAVLPARASVQINGTRVIYNAADRDVSVQLTNPGKHPVLVQAWLDAGDPDARPEKASTPFVLTPPLARLREGGGQTLRLAFVGPQALPGDRESVYWMNVLEIPPEADKNSSELQLQLAFRSRIKLFYRPAGLNAEQAVRAPQQLRWQAGEGKIILSNPTPYFVSLTGLKIDGAGKSLTLDADMLAPKGESAFSLPGGQRLTGSEKVTVTYVNDYGATSSQQIAHR